MNHSWKVGFNFGVTSGIITTLGLMVGLDSATSSKLVVIGGILTIAIADACSDALGIHIAEEGEQIHTRKEVWQSTFSTFFFKFVFASIFILPFLFLSLGFAVALDIALGFVLLGIFSYKLHSRRRGKVVAEHLIMAGFVIVVSYFVGKFIGMFI